MMLGPAPTPPSAYHLPTLSSILLEREEPYGDMFIPPLDGFSRTFYAYVLHTHIYEWRQNVCMLNSNGLTGAILSFVLGATGHRKGVGIAGHRLAVGRPLAYAFAASRTPIRDACRVELHLDPPPSGRSGRRL